MPIAADPENPQPLRTLRRSRRLSQMDVALMADEDQTVLSRLERGERIPTREQIAKLARALKCKPEDLFDRATLAVVAARHKAASS